MCFNPSFSQSPFIILRDWCRLKDNIRIDPSPVRTHTHTPTYSANTSIGRERKQEVSLNSGLTLQSLPVFLFSIASVFYCILVGLWHASKKSRQHSPRTYFSIYLLVFFLVLCYFFLYFIFYFYFLITRKMFYDNYIIIC